MINVLLASAALLAGTALAGGPGSAIVINKCNYDVFLANTPSAGGGYNTISQTLSPGGSYSQVYTELSNGNGWSLKLSPTAGAFSSDIMQYEYTFHNDGIIWFDLSDVNGNPWNGNWMITADGSCTPKQTAYQYATDDAYGMQACPDGSTVTVTLCSGASQGAQSRGAAYPSTSAGAAPAWTPSTTATSSTSAVVSAKKPHHSHQTWGVGAGNGAVEAPAKNAVAAPSPSTMATSVITSAANNGGTTVTNIQYEVVTQYVTATNAPSKRHEHLARHAHHHHF